MQALFVDDIEANLMLGEAILKRLGFSVVLASSGAEAFRIFQSTFFDLVLTDYHMPNMNGAELTSAIRRVEYVEKRKPTRILAVSAAPTDEVKKDLESAGVDIFLPKPMRLFEVLEVIKPYFEKMNME